MSKHDETTIRIPVEMREPSEAWLAEHARLKPAGRPPTLEDVVGIFVVDLWRTQEDPDSFEARLIHGYLRAHGMLGGAQERL